MKEVRRALMVVLALSVHLTGCGDDAEPDSPSEEEETPDAGNKPVKVRDAGPTAMESDAAEMDEDINPATGHDAAAPQDAGGKDAAVKDAGGSTDAGSSGGSDAGANACATLTYASFGSAFMTNYCVSCHGPQRAEKNIRLDSLSGVTSAKGKVKAEVNASAMPPRGSKAPSSAERRQLSQWIDCGPK